MGSDLILILNFYGAERSFEVYRQDVKYVNIYTLDPSYNEINPNLKILTLTKILFTAEMEHGKPSKGSFMNLPRKLPSWLKPCLPTN